MRIMRSLFFCLVAFAAVVAGAGETFKWTGAASASWTNAANWQLKSGETYVAATRCPGNGSDHLGDECIFGPLADGGSTVVDISLDKFGSETYKNAVTNVYRINFIAGAPSYTFKGPAMTRTKSTAPQDYTCLKFENGGGITIDSDVTNDQHFECVFGGVSRNSPFAYSDLSINMYLNAPGNTLYLNGYFNDASGKGSYVSISGKGNLVWSGESYGDWGPSYFSVGNTGTVEFRSTSSGLQPKSWSFNNNSKITIPSGYVSLCARDGGDTKDAGVTFYKTVTVDGGGALLLYSQQTYDTYGITAASGAEVTLDVVLKKSNKTSTYVNRSALLCGAGTFILCSSNDFSGALMLKGGVTVKAAKLGLKGCTRLESNIGTGDQVIYRSSGTLKYTGVGETCDRDFTITNYAKVATLTAGVINSGSGTLVLTGNFRADSAGTTFKMGGTETSPVDFNGTFDAESENVALQVAGVLDLASLEAIPEKITAFTFAAGANKLIVPEGKQSVIVGWTTPAAGSSINFVARNGATVKLGGISAAALLPNNVQLNGEPAKVDANGVMTSAYAYWKTARDGNWNESAKWKSGEVPTALDHVLVNASGADYTVTVSDSSAEASKYITVGTGSDDNTATVALGKNVFLDGTRDIRIVKGGKVTIGGENTFEWGDASKVTDTNLLFGGEMVFADDSQLIVSNRISSSSSGVLIMGTGTTTLTNNARFVSQDYLSSGDQMYVTPSTEGGESRVRFFDTAHWISRSNNSAIHIGRNSGSGVGVCDVELENNDRKLSQDIDGYTAGMVSWYVGNATQGRKGTGVLNLKRGYLLFSNNGMNAGMAAGGVMADWIAANSGTVISGLVNQTSGIVAGGSYMPGYQNNAISGFIVGNGIRVYEGNVVYGEYNLKAGTIDATAGFAVIGSGPSAYGVFNVGDEDNENAAQSVKLNGPWGQGGGNYHNVTVIGFGKGKGLMKVFGPKAEVFFRGGLYIGGTDVAGLRIAANGTSTRPAYTDAGCQSGTREAVGEFRVSAGKIQSYYSDGKSRSEWWNIWVGADGKGTLAMSGAADVQCDNLVLSNRNESVVKFTLPANGVPGWNLEAKRAIYITDGAELVVDASQVTTSHKWTKLATAAAAPDTEADNQFRDGKFTVLGDNAAARRYAGATIVYQRGDEHGIWLQSPSLGGVILLR